MAIFDATNSTSARRQYLIDRFHNKVLTCRRSTYPSIALLSPKQIVMMHTGLHCKRLTVNS